MSKYQQIFFAIMLFLLNLIIPKQVEAQLPREFPEVITVDTQKFPEITVQVAPPLTTSLGDETLSASNWEILEDGKAQEIIRFSKIEREIQIGFIFDIAGNVDKEGATGAPVREELMEIMSDLLLTNKSIGVQHKDYLELIVPEGTNSYKVAQNWTYDPNRIYNQAYLKLNSPIEKMTALYAITLASISSMKYVENYVYNPKVLIILSDGVDKTSPQNVTDIISRAQALNVVLLTIKIGPTTMGNASSLQRMAEETNGISIMYTEKKDLEIIHTYIRALRIGYELTYRSTATNSGQHFIKAKLHTEKTSLSSNDFPFGITVLPPQPTITSPSPGKIERSTQSWETDPTTIEPRSLLVTLEVRFPDGHPRALREVRYLVNGAMVAKTLPTEGFAWDISSLSSGKYSLQAEVIDEIGLAGRSDPVTVDIEVSRPEPPVSTKTPEELEEASRLQKRETLLRLIIAIALIAAGVALIVSISAYIRHPRQTREAISNITDTIKTKVFRRTPGVSPQPALAYLIEKDSSGPGRRYEILNQSVYIGRDPSRADITFQDLTVSRLHARIAEVEDNEFWIYDEGSTSGTFVNGEMVTAKGKMLNDGDIIYLGRIELQFKLDRLSDVPGIKTEILRGQKSDPGETEKFEP